MDEALALVVALRNTGKMVPVLGIAAFNDMALPPMMFGQLQQSVEAPLLVCQSAQPLC